VGDQSGRNWMAHLQSFLPPGTKSFFALDAARQAEVWAAASGTLTRAERRRLIEDAPAADRARLRALIGDPDGK
jgi:hypothetical protein